MVDREARDKFAELVRHLANGRITETDFDDALESLPFSGKDRIVDAIFEETFGIKEAPRREVARWILFLQSDLEYKWPGLDDIPNPFVIIALVAVWWILGGHLHSPTARWWIAAAVTAFYALINSYINPNRRKPGDMSVWPFHQQTDINEAVRHPRLLNGRHNR